MPEKEKYGATVERNKISSLGLKDVTRISSKLANPSRRSITFELVTSLSKLGRVLGSSKSLRAK